MGYHKNTVLVFSAIAVLGCTQVEPCAADQGPVNFPADNQTIAITEHSAKVLRGEGQFGDLLTLTLQDGSMLFDGAEDTFFPISFKITDGETKSLSILSRSGVRGNLSISYRDRRLIIDAVESPSAAASFSYTTDWATGRTFNDIHTSGPMSLQGVRLEVRTLFLKRSETGDAVILFTP